MSDLRSPNREAVAAEVRAQMGRARVSQTRLAGVLKMSQSALSRRLNAEQPFDIDELFDLAKFFDVEVTRLLGPPYTAWFTEGEGRAEPLVVAADSGTRAA